MGERVELAGSRCAFRLCQPEARVDGVPSARENGCNCIADAGARTGHEDDLCAGEVVHHAMPPFARTIWPLIQPASGDARKATRLAISLGCPRRFCGAMATMRSMSAWDFPRRNSSVSTGPGAMAFTVMPRDPSSFRSEEHTSELQSLMRISYAVFCLKKKKKQ